MSDLSHPIPHTVEPRPDTGLTNGKIGVWLFLASEAMLFGALFASYIVLRLGAPSWPRGAELLNVPLGTVNTVVLITSSVTMVLAWASLLRERPEAHRRYLGATVLLGLLFLAFKGVEWWAKLAHGEVPATSTFFALYYTLTGLHALHVAGGVGVNGWLWLAGPKLRRRRPRQLTNRVENAGLYWHFVDLVWIFLFPVLYLL